MPRFQEPSDEKGITNYITVGDVDLELFICTEILKLNSLHFGYWEAAEDLNLDNVRKAQGRYTEKLIASIPPGVRTILDVGCGIGDNARAMSAQGYAVTALSPDGNHGKYFAGDKTIHFHKTRFEDFQTDERFDLILMSESQNYFEAEPALKQCQGLLQSGGHLLICGMFRKNATSVFKHVRNIESDFCARSARHGLALVSRTDITDRILRTLEYAEKAHREYLAPSLAMASRYLNHVAPRKMRLLKLLFQKQFRDLETIDHYYREFFTPALFREHVMYLTLLFQFSQRAVA